MTPAHKNRLSYDSATMNGKRNPLRTVSGLGQRDLAKRPGRRIIESIVKQAAQRVKANPPSPPHRDTRLVRNLYMHSLSPTSDNVAREYTTRKIVWKYAVGSRLYARRGSRTGNTFIAVATPPRDRSRPPQDFCPSTKRPPRITPPLVRW